MKRQYYIPITLFIVSSSIISCKKTFLDKIPPTSVSTAIFWASESDVQSAVTGIYAGLNENFLGYERVYLDGFSDNALNTANTNQSGIQDIATSGLIPTSGVISNLYSTPYKMVANANYFLANVDKAPITDTAKNRYSAEVKFMRAFAYFELVQNFGDVVLYTAPPATLDAAKIKQSPKEKVYALIESDLDFAIATLPDTKYNGHAVKGTAQALKAKVLLTEQKWGDAATLLNQIIAGHVGKFGLSNDYAALFTTAGQSNSAVNIEIMFSTQYLAPTKIQRSLQGMDLELGSYAEMQPLQDLVDDYQCTDGKPISTSPLYDTAHPYANRDPRLDLSVKLPGEKWLTSTGAEYVPTAATTLVSPFMVEKYVDRSRFPITTATANSTDQDYIHLRYADVLLMYAEAQNELAGPSAAVYAAIDSVRARKGINMPPVVESTYNTQALLRDYIRHERRVEFALEGQRYNDLKRWKIADIKLPTVKDPKGRPYIFKPFYYYMPFPQVEMDANSALDQKPGYNG